VGREEAEGDDDGLFESLEVVLIETGVDDEDEDGRDLSGAGEGVLDGGVFREEFGGEVVGGDVLVVRREGVALQAEGADPQLAANVDLTVGVKDGSAGSLAGDGFVEDGRKVGAILQRGVKLWKETRVSWKGRVTRGRRGETRRTAPMGTTVRVASILDPAQTFQESLTPSRSSTSSKSKARCPLMVGGGGTCRVRD
jgi:hypothetical protein